MPLGLYFRTCSPSIALLLLLSSNFLLCWGAYHDRPAAVISLRRVEFPVFYDWQWILFIFQMSVEGSNHDSKAVWLIILAVFVFQFGVELFSSAGSCFSISKAMLFPSHHVFHTLNQNDVLLLVLLFFAPFRSSSIVSSVARVNLSWFNAAIFFSIEKTFFKVSAENFRHHFTWYHWLRKFPIVFQPIIIQNIDV